MLELALPVLGAFGESVLSKLFVGAASDKVKSSLVAMRANHAKDRAVMMLLDSLEPFFRAEMSDSDTMLLVNALQTRFQDIAITPTWLATYRFDVGAMVRDIAQKESAEACSVPVELQPILDDLTRQTLTVAIEMANVVPAWERLAWRSNFEAFDKLQAKLDGQAKLLTKLIEAPTRALDSFEGEYRRRVKAECEKITVKGIGTVGDIKTLSLDALFIHMGLKRSLDEADLRASGAPVHASAESDPRPSTKIQSEVVDPVAAISESRKLIILGGPGTGKSTLVQFIALHAVSGQDPLERENTPVPFFLRVRSFTNFDSLPNPKDFISLCAHILDSNEAQTFVTKVLREKRAWILIDGLDECEIKPSDAGANSTRQSEREKVLAWIEQISSAFPGNVVVVTSRPVGYRKGELSQAGFVAYEIPPLSVDQQREFIERWYEAVEQSALPDDPAIARSTASGKSRDLTGRIRSAPSAAVLAYNPLMLSVICILHRQRGESIRERKVDLLDDCLNVLLYDWRQAHGLKRSVIGDLDSRQLRALLGPLAWQMVIDGKEQVPGDFVTKSLSAHLPEIQQPPARAAEILDVIRDRTGVLVEVAPNTYSFMHLLFQEFLAAEECAQAGKAYDVLLSNAKDPRWKEIIPMAVTASKGSHEMLVRGLLNAGYVTLAASAMAMVERVTIGLRSEVIAALSNYVLRLREHFDYQDLASVVEVGTVEAIEEIMRLLFALPLLSTADYRDFAVHWHFEDNPISIDEIARNTVQRALLWRDLDLGEPWGYTRDIGYFSDTSGIGRSASWSSLDVGLRIPTANTNTNANANESGNANESEGASESEAPAASDKQIASDPIYNYAVLLDTGDRFRGPVSAVCWKAFMLLMSDSASISPEHKLLALQFTWYFTNPQDYILELLQFLSEFPAEVCPAFQVGILNNAMSRLDREMAEQVRERAEALWRREFEQVESKVRELIEVWKNDFSAVSVNGQAVSPDDFGKYFSTCVKEYITGQQIFPA